MSTCIDLKEQQRWLDQNSVIGASISFWSQLFLLTIRMLKFGAPSQYNYVIQATHCKKSVVQLASSTIQFRSENRAVRGLNKSRPSEVFKQQEGDKFDHVNALKCWIGLTVKAWLVVSLVFFGSDQSYAVWGVETTKNCCFFRL